MTDPQQRPRSANPNPFAALSVGVALFALVAGAFTIAGAAFGLLGVALGGLGVRRAERTEIGLAASLFGIAFGVVAVLWTAAHAGS